MMSSDRTKKAPDSRDRHVGARVRMRRKVIGMSQDRLAKALGVTFQQVQKYEKGSNRVSSSRLADIAAALGVSIASFYEGIDADGLSASPDPIVELLTMREGIELARAFMAMPDPKTRRSLIELAKAIARSSAS